MKISERLEPKILLVEGAAAKGFTTEVDVRLLFQFATGRAPVLFIYEAGSSNTKRASGTNVLLARAPIPF